MVGLRAIRDQAKTDADRVQLTLDSAGNQAVTPDTLETFSSAARDGLWLEGGGYRRHAPRAASVANLLPTRTRSVLAE
jgi:hypothetical protein